MKVTVKNRKISLDTGYAVEDNINVDSLTVQFEDTDGIGWEDLDKVVVFKSGVVEKKVVLDAETIPVPWEVLQAEDRMYLTIIGTRTEPYKRVVTEKMFGGIRIRPAGNTGGDGTTEATPDVVTQILGNSEFARKTAEDLTKSEEERKEAEALREKNEDERNSAETVRIENEIVRNNNENARILAENTRTLSETERKNTFAGWEKSVEGMEQAEAERILNETERKNAEGERITAESDRQRAEEGRISAENDRISAENERNTAETARENAEGERQAAENARAFNEAERIEAERLRAEVEAERCEAETKRATAEEARALEEADRVTAEENRQAAELEREKFFGSVEGEITELKADFQKQIADLESFVGYTDDDIYGVEVDFVNKKFTRLAGAANRTPGEGFDGINAFGGRRRCNVDNSGNVIAYYGDAGFTTTGKLTQAVTVGEGEAAVTYPVGTIVQVMVEQPKFYYKVVPLKIEKKAKGGITRKVAYYVSDSEKVGFKLHPAFICDGKENEKIYLAAFEGSLWDASAAAYILDDSQVADFANDMLCSIANAKPASGLTQQLNRANTRKLAEKRGAGWEQATIQAACASELLMLIEYATFNMQSAIGVGNVSKIDDSATSMTELTGATVNLGNASGAVTNDNGINIVSYRGEENFWGNIWKWIDGINFNGDRRAVYIADHGFADDTDASPYVDAGITVSDANGYVSAFCYSEAFDWLFIAGEVAGNSSLPVGDYFYRNSGWRVARFGGSWDYGSAVGAFFWAVNYASFGGANRYVGGRLVYVPTANI